MSAGCPSITKPYGGEIIPNKSYYEFGESVTVLCRKDYDLIGDESPGGVLDFGLDGGVPPGPRHPNPCLE